jgi:peptide/nickel transport system permease protein
MAGSSFSSRQDTRDSTNLPPFSQPGRFWLQEKTYALGSIIVLGFLLLAFFGPMLARYGANEQLAGKVLLSPTFAHPFGTDHLGRDVFSRILIGARDILALAGLGTFLALIAGTILGLISGYRGGWFDEIFMRLFDSLLAIPLLLFALLLLGTLGTSRQGILIVIIIVFTPIVARVVRSVVLSEKGKDYVASARLYGESTLSIVFIEIFPATLSVLAVEGAIRFSYAIFLVASLGFLGIGVQPPNPDWGLMVNEARIYASQAPWTLLFPAMAIALLVVGLNLFSEGTRRFLVDRDG